MFTELKNENSFKEYIENHGKTKDELNEYLDFLFANKKSKNGGSGITAESLHNCAIVSIADGKIKTLSLDEFIKGYNLELNKKLEKKFKKFSKKIIWYEDVVYCASGQIRNLFCKFDRLLICTPKVGQVS